jgi:hypothetical protein
MVGLFFFIRASVKDRTQQIHFLAERPEESVLNQLEEYFARRAYQVESVDPEQNQISWQGYVQPSKFLAIFLTLLAALSLLCLSLVFSLLFPSIGNLSLVLILLAPAAGFFYWRKAGRIERVLLQVGSATSEGKTPISIAAHRDELIQLQQFLSLELGEQ